MQSSSARRDHMLLIPGLLKCIDRNLLDFLDSSVNYAQIFIVTEKEYKSESSLLVQRYDAKAWFFEDLMSSLPQDILSRCSGQYSQWLKFHLALSQALAWETENDCQFMYFHKIRSDVIFPDNFENLMISGLARKNPTSNFLLSAHDFCFSGNREVFNVLKSFLQFMYDYLSDRTKLVSVLNSFNPRQLKNSDLNSAPYLGAFPVQLLADGELLGKIQEDFELIIAQNGLKMALVELADRFSSSLDDEKLEKLLPLILVNSPRVRCLRDRLYHHRIDFIYSRFLNSFDICTLSYPLPIQLKQARHAVTDTTHLIFQLIDDSNYSFLSNLNLNWDSIIKSFIESGGSIVKFFRIFTVLLLRHGGKFSKDQIMTLGVIYNSSIRLSDLNAIQFLTVDFVNCANKYDIDLPCHLVDQMAGAADMIKAQNLAEAKEVILGLIKLHAGNPYLLLYLLAINTFRGLGDHFSSLEFSNELIRIFPYYWQGFKLASQDLAQLQRFDDAIFMIENGLTRFSSHIELLKLGVSLCESFGQYSKSLEYSRRIAFCYPELADGFISSIHCLLKLKMYSDAVSEIEIVLQKFPSNPSLFMLANHVYRSSGDRSKALLNSESLVKHYPSFWPGYHKCAQDLLALDRRSEAQAILRRGLALFQNQSELLELDARIKGLSSE